MTIPIQNRLTGYPANKHKINDFFRVNKSTIKNILEDKSRYYRVWFIDKGNGKKRKITEPLDALKNIQTILKKIFQQYDNIANVYGFRKHKSIADNASRHRGATAVLNMDIKDFFPSVKADMVYNIIEAIEPIFNVASDYIQTIVELLTYKNELPQGSPASPTIANLAMRKGDRAIETILDRYEKRPELNRPFRYIYSRYADDITVSAHRNCFRMIEDNETSDLRGLIKPIAWALRNEGFQVNWKKTRVMAPHKQMNVTGVIINPLVTLNGASQCRAPMKYKDKIRAALHNISCGHPINEENEQKIIGMLAHVENIDPCGFEKLKYNIFKVLDSRYGSHKLKRLMKDKLQERIVCIRQRAIRTYLQQGTKIFGIFETTDYLQIHLSVDETVYRKFHHKDTKKAAKVASVYTQVISNVKKSIILCTKQNSKELVFIIQKALKVPKWQLILYGIQMCNSLKSVFDPEQLAKTMIAYSDYADANCNVEKIANSEKYSMVEIDNHNIALIVR